MQDVPAWAALVTTLLGGAGVKIADRFLFARGKGRERDIGVAEQIREELRGEIDGLRLELRAVERRLDEWRERYHVLRDAYGAIKARCKVLYNELEFIRTHMRARDGKDPQSSPADSIAALQFDDTAMRRLDEEIGEEQRTKDRENGDGNGD